VGVMGLDIRVHLRHPQIGEHRRAVEGVPDQVGGGGRRLVADHAQAERAVDRVDAAEQGDVEDVDEGDKQEQEGEPEGHQQQDEAEEPQPDADGSVRVLLAVDVEAHSAMPGERCQRFQQNGMRRMSGVASQDPSGPKAASTAMVRPM
jgi:hypothetical protein